MATLNAETTITSKGELLRNALMDSTTRQAKLRQLKQQQDHQFAKQMLEQLGIASNRAAWLLPEEQGAIDCVEWLKCAFPWQWSQIDWFFHYSLTIGIPDCGTQSKLVHRMPSRRDLCFGYGEIVDGIV